MKELAQERKMGGLDREERKGAVTSDYGTQTQPRCQELSLMRT